VNDIQAGTLPLRLGFVKAFLVRGAEKHMLVDSGTAGSSTKIVAQLERGGVNLKDIGLIVVTHAHADHTGSLADVVQATGAKVAAHRLEAEYVRTGMSPPAARNRLSKIIFRPSTKPRAAGVEPDILVDDELDLNPYGVAGKVIWTPGHTRGSVSVVLESGEAIVGDLVLPRFMSFGPPAIAFWAASREDSVASIRKVLDLKPSIILTSHGGPYTPGALARLSR
jgi:glyoxylase-like metal-dependent hydrolase (beta-lactamase superfamily II)